MFSYKLDFSIEDGGHVTLSYHSENENMLTPFMFPNHSVIQEQNFRTIYTCGWVKKWEMGKKVEIGKSVFCHRKTSRGTTTCILMKS